MNISVISPEIDPDLAMLRYFLFCAWVVVTLALCVVLISYGLWKAFTQVFLVQGAIFVFLNILKKYQ